uniref:2-amino-4-hydroxy-6-hydroxymethyldihydropteridine diphosphokinase n=1 Tax=Paulinella micropora TaxID=1928728 RepID=A0A385I0N2_9EUKA|nr:putative 2-amino-4-hydroxy-6- hydroxymethyldihydropteridinepyrophosphokinase [Paulinella micropora]AXY63435.1 putative 2-amino-4-hydroxy-6- hydroxymethyldihydropteridinepyrophosphokinase [Paulinella micropora]
MSNLTKLTLGIALGANLNSPLDTLLGLRSLLTLELSNWSSLILVTRCNEGYLYWSPLFYTEPIKTSLTQPPYLNAILVVILSVPLTSLSIQLSQAQNLLNRLQKLENLFGRLHLEHWGSRTLDLDLLWYGNLQFTSLTITLPHPHLLERGFVLSPLTATFSNIVFPLKYQRFDESLKEIISIDFGKAPKALNTALTWPDTV